MNKHVKKTDVRQCKVLKKLLGNGLEGDWKLEMTGWQGRICLDMVRPQVTDDGGR